MQNVPTMCFISEPSCMCACVNIDACVCVMCKGGK